MSNIRSHSYQLEIRSALSHEIYELGNTIDDNESLASEFYKQAAEEGHIKEKYKLGHCYEHGIGTDIDKEKAFEPYRVVFKKRNYEAQKRLADIYISKCK